MKKSLAIVLFSLIAVQQAAATRAPTYSECVEMGIQYYKEIGSYPKLSTGEDALEKVLAICKNSLLAFGAKE